MAFGAKSDSWRTIAPSCITWRAAALDALRTHFGNGHAFACWSNFQFASVDGALHEVDLLAITRRNVILITIDPRPPAARETGPCRCQTESDSRPTGHWFADPARLARVAALARQLRHSIDVWAENRGSQRRCPPIQGAVFHSTFDAPLPAEPKPGPAGAPNVEGLDGRFVVAPLAPADSTWDDAPSRSLLTNEPGTPNFEFAWLADELAWQSVVVPLFDVYFLEAEVKPRADEVAGRQLLAEMARVCQSRSPERVIAEWTQVAIDLQQRQLPLAFLNDVDDDLASCLCERIELARNAWHELRGRMRAVQDELDWHEYYRAGVVDEDLSLLGLAHDRAPLDATALFQLAPASVALEHLAMELAATLPVGAGEAAVDSLELPETWPMEYREKVRRRAARIRQSRTLAELERPRYKRSWEIRPWESQRDKALREWMLDRLATHMAIENPTRDLTGPRLEAADRPLTPRSLARLVDSVANDQLFLNAAHCLRGERDPNLTGLVIELLG